jgi:hypothetical protein
MYPLTGFKEVVQVFYKAFPGTILVPIEEEAAKRAVFSYHGLSMWSG